MTIQNPGATRTATFAGGCFWCTESDFEKTPGITAVISGYTGGTVANPSYKQVCTGTTGRMIEQVGRDAEPGIGGIRLWFSGQPQKRLHHVLHLGFIRSTSTHHRLLHLPGRILMDRQAAVGGTDDCSSPCLTELQGRVRIPPCFSPDKRWAAPGIG